jgi:hypothetical protein
MPDPVLDEPRGIRSVGYWMLRILPLLALLALMGWGASTITRLRHNNECEPTPQSAQSGDTRDPGQIRCQ